MPYPLYLSIIQKVPDYIRGTRKICRHHIQDIMSEFEYDEDYIESVNDDFCQGFGVAKDITVKILKNLETERQSKQNYYFFQEQTQQTHTGITHTQTLLYSSSEESKEKAIQNFQNLYPGINMDTITIATGHLYF